MYRTHWHRSALDDLTNAWLEANSEERPQVNLAASNIEAQLRTDPYQESESRDNDLRVMFVGTLGVLFQVNDITRIVDVVHLWKFRQRRP